MPADGIDCTEGEGVNPPIELEMKDMAAKSHNGSNPPISCSHGVGLFSHLGQL